MKDEIYGEFPTGLSRTKYFQRRFAEVKFLTNPSTYSLLLLENELTDL